jgi:hypothetical protein
MSITFWAPAAPTVRVKPYDDEPDYEEDQSTLPEINLANSNALAFLRLLGVEAEYCGTFTVKDQEALLPRLLLLANSADARGPAVREPSMEQTVHRSIEGNLVQLTRGARMFDCGLGDEQVQSYALRMLDLFKQAHVGGYNVSWG